MLPVNDNMIYTIQYLSILNTANFVLRPTFVFFLNSTFLVVILLLFFTCLVTLLELESADCYYLLVR